MGVKFPRSVQFSIFYKKLLRNYKSVELGKKNKSLFWGSFEVFISVVLR